ncbi:hypothetical protein [Singulisphaera sp. PoT]|uniref:hypothetical protein n=1 Tax=Singulisphaera sp. PoT TaxID=3411797 RepID=UPI003BF50B3E
MKIQENFNTPWSMRIERDGTEDIAVIVDAGGDELLRSRPFRLPEDDEPVPPELAAMRLILAAPKLLAALEGVIVHAESKARGPESPKDCAEDDAEAGRAWRPLERSTFVLDDAEGAKPHPAPAEADIRALLARRGQIAAVWRVEDVQAIRPDLDDGRAWQVLAAVEDQLDASLGITWDTLKDAAICLFGESPETDEA